VQALPQTFLECLGVCMCAHQNCDGLQAIKLYKRATPESIISSRQLLLQQCITPRVELSAGVWHYPEPQTLGPGLWSQRRFMALMQQLTRLPLPGRARLVLRHAQLGSACMSIWRLRIKVVLQT
jgi:hypothetical protein